MVIIQETIPTRTEVQERMASFESALALSGLERTVAVIDRPRPIPAALMALDGRPHSSLTAADWRAIAKHQEPEIYYHGPEIFLDGGDWIMPGSEEALGLDF